MISARDVFGVALVVALAISVIVGGAMQRDPDIFRVLFGTIGILPLAAALGTLAMLFVQARHSDKTLQHGQRAERSSRFQKATEMMANESNAAAIAGLTIVKEIASEDLATYHAPGLHLVIEAMNDRDRDVMKRAKVAVKNKQPVEEPDDGSSNFTAAAFVALSEFYVGNTWPIDHPRVIDGRLQIGEMFLGDRFFVDANFERLAIAKALWGRVGFERCNFRKGRLQILATAYVQFIECDLRGVELGLRGPDGPLDGPGLVSFENCLIDDAIVNDDLLSNWLAR